MRKEGRAPRCPQPAVLAPETTAATTGHLRKVRNFSSLILVIIYIAEVKIITTKKQTRAGRFN